jgi:hypothetical protein
MNRLQRRAAKAMSYNAPVNPVTAIHEAGHAVFAVMFSPLAGWQPPNGALNHIDLHAEPPVFTEALLKPVEAPGGATEWSMFPPKMKAYVRPFMERYANYDVIAFGDLQSAFTEMRAAGFDLNLWLRTRLLIGFAGLAAEAKFTGKPMNDVLKSNISNLDLVHNARDCQLCDLTKDKYSEEMTRASILAEHCVEIPEVWIPTTALAAQLKHGRISAGECVRIIRQSTPEDNCLLPSVRDRLTRESYGN